MTPLTVFRKLVVSSTVDADTNLSQIDRHELQKRRKNGLKMSEEIRLERERLFKIDEVHLQSREETLTRINEYNLNYKKFCFFDKNGVVRTKYKLKKSKPSPKKRRRATPELIAQRKQLKKEKRIKARIELKANPEKYAEFKKQANLYHTAYRNLHKKKKRKND